MEAFTMTMHQRTALSKKLHVVVWTLVVVVVALWTTTTTIPQVHALAAASKRKSSGGGGGGGKNRGGSSTNKGFGAPPPSLEDVLSKFPTYMPTTDAATLVDYCPCGIMSPQQKYSDCCGPLHDKTRSCTTMLDVLKSRYSAFYFRNIRHIMDTTHPTCRDFREDKIAWAKDLNKDGMFDSFEFVKLSVLGDPEFVNDNEGFVEFQVTLRGRDDETMIRGARRSASAVAGLETVIKERSRFLRDAETGIWAYASGDVSSEEAGLQDIKLNN